MRTSSRITVASPPTGTRSFVPSGAIGGFRIHDDGRILECGGVSLAFAGVLREDGTGVREWLDYVRSIVGVGEV